MFRGTGHMRDIPFVDPPLDTTEIVCLITEQTSLYSEFCWVEWVWCTVLLHFQYSYCWRYGCSCVYIIPYAAHFLDENLKHKLLPFVYGNICQMQKANKMGTILPHVYIFIIFTCWSNAMA